jgi:hypothetical protein
MRLLASCFFALLSTVCINAQQVGPANSPVLHNQCLGAPKNTGQGQEHGEIAVENVCKNSISARVCVKYARTGWACQLFPAVLPHGLMKAVWSVGSTGAVIDVKSWATDYVGGNDYKNLPTVDQPSKVIMSR